MTFLVYETKFTVEKSEKMVFTAGKQRGRWAGGGLDTLGEIPLPKRCLDKTLPQCDRGSPSNDNVKPGPNSEHS